MFTAAVLYSLGSTEFSFCCLGAAAAPLLSLLSASERDDDLASMTIDGFLFIMTAAASDSVDQRSVLPLDEERACHFLPENQLGLWSSKSCSATL